MESTGYNLSQALHISYQEEDSLQQDLQPEPLIDDDDDYVRPAINIRETGIMVEEDTTKVKLLSAVKKRVVDNFRDFGTETAIQESLARGESLAKQPRMEDLYRVPIEITFHSDFNTAKKVAHKDGKWILVVINDENFPSLALNRDIFNAPKHPEVKEMIKNNFIFIRKRFDDEDGSKIIQNYQLSGQSFPIILLVDPTTGELRHNFGETKNVTPRNFIHEISKYRSEQKKLIYNPNVIDLTAEDEAEQFHATSSKYITPQASHSSRSFGFNGDSDKIITVESDEFESPSECSDNEIEVESSDDQAPVSFKKSEGHNGISVKSQEIDITKPAEVPRPKRSDTNVVIHELPDLDPPDVIETIENTSSEEEEEEEENIGGPETSISLRMEDGKANNFKFRSNQTISKLVTHIFKKYLIPIGQKKERMVLFTRIHNECLTNMDQNKTLVEIKLHPSAVIYHNTNKI